LFICFTVDHRILWGQITEKDIEDGFHFYRAFYNAPPAIRVRLRWSSFASYTRSLTRGYQTLLHSMFLVTLAGFFAKLHKWDDSAMFFDGSSIGEVFLSRFASKEFQLTPAIVCSCVCLCPLCLLRCYRSRPAHHQLACYRG
jgi:hypothetical protein